ncbi:hypothetical protein GCM10023211_24160 [Orbus sasakiae]|uniref:Arginase n=1 Tax=Orbus sasakiae TaxID=1078475 RepID=A0ABP9NCG3_9GAMM
MKTPIILNFDNSVGNIDGALTISLADYQERIRFGCSQQHYRSLCEHLAPLLPDHHYGPVLMGSGDYHHLSLFLIERLAQHYSATNPIQVVIFDNHPDNMRFPFGIHCGSWVSHVAKLPFVSHVHVMGICSNDIGNAHCFENRLLPLYRKKLTYWTLNHNTQWAKYLGLSKAFRCFHSADEMISAFIATQDKLALPTYLSIDKDVLSEHVIKTNWDQGQLAVYHLADTITALGHDIIGSDITGELSSYHYQTRWKRVLSSLDAQPDIALDKLHEWQGEQHQLNRQLLTLLG